MHTLEDLETDFFSRLQNSPNFCVFKYARAVFLRIQVRASSQTKGLEWGWKQRARLGETLTPRFTDFFTDFEKKTDCFAVYFFSDAYP